MIKSTYLIVEASSLFFFFFLWDELLCNAPVVFPTGLSRNVLLALPLEATFTDVRGELQPLHLFPLPVSNWLP